MTMKAWWLPDKVDAVVTREYIVDKIGEKNHIRLHTPAFGDGLTNATYIDWILAGCKRLFMILNDVGCVENIFEAVDQSYDDRDLPLSAQDITDLKLSSGKNASLERKFYKRQFYYLIQELGPGKHVDYGSDDVIPVRPVSKTKGILSSPDIDRVYVGNKVLTRRRIDLGGEHGVDRVHFIFYFKSLQMYRHPHLVSVWATYTQGDHAYVLISPASDTTLKSFLEEPPKSFRDLSKQMKRDILLRWVHCLTDAVTYLHEHGLSHQAIRPSNIFIDEEHNIFLGEYAAMDALEEEEAAYKREAYEHAPPEKWKRKPILQETAPLRSMQNGGGRTRRRLKIPTARENASRNAPGRNLSFSSLINKDNTSNEISRRNTPQSGLAFPKPPTTLTPPSNSPSHSPSASIASTFIPDTLLTYYPAVANSSLVPRSPTSTRKYSVAPTMASTNSSGSVKSAATISKRVVVNTFAQEDLPTPYPSDIFSLSTIQVQLLSAMFSLGSSSITSNRYNTASLRNHLGRLNVSAGRGGAPPDSSFHLNLGQVETWLTKLEKEAIKRQDGHFTAAAELTNTVRKGLRKVWQERYKARDCEKETRGILDKYLAGGCGTCCAVGATMNERGSGFGLGLDGNGDVEIGERKSGSGGQTWIPSPPLSENGGASRDGNGISRRGSFAGSIGDAESVIYLEGVGVEGSRGEKSDWPLRVGNGGWKDNGGEVIDENVVREFFRR